MDPLNGLRVLDLADEKGELCGRLLAEWGADVIRVEPEGGARSRRLPPFAPDGESSLYFAVRNAGKRGTTLDLGSPSGRAGLHALAADADLLIESGAPGEMASLGLDPLDLVERHPQLIVTSISDFGQTGPYRDFLGTDMIGFAMGGMMHRAGSAQRPPVVAPGALAYDAAGVTAAYASLLAYWQRLQNGRGQHVDVSVYESVANLSDWAMPNFSRSPQVGQRAGAGIYTLYRCADGWVRMIVLVVHHWRALLDWIGNPEELQDPALEVFISRLMKMDRIQHHVELAFAGQNKIDLAREAQRRGIPATPLLEPGEVIANEHCAARSTFQKLEVAPGVSALAPVGFLSIDGERASARGCAPPAGETAEISWEDSPHTKAPGPWEGTGAGDGYPLRGLKVLDFGVGAVGVEVGRLLAEYGADVVKIESRKAPDFIRIIMGGMMNPNFASSSRSKRCLGVDLKSERGAALLRRLAKWADVTIENNGAGVMDRLGLGAQTLHEINPKLVTFSSQIVGSSGPWSNWIGYGPSTHAVSGLQWLWNYPEDIEQPAGSTNVYPDHFVGRLGAAAVVAGLVGRARTGRGLHADAAQFESVIQLLGDLFAKESLAPGSVQPQGNASDRGAPWGAYPCAGEDEWCVINVRDDDEWRRLADVLDRPEWTQRGEYANASRRRAEREALDRQLADWTRLHTSREVMETLQRAGVPAGMVQHAGHHLEDPHLAARDYHREIEQPDLGRVVLEGPAFRGSELPEPIVEPAPGLGEHTRGIAAELLGLSPSEIAELIEAGVLEDPPEA
jgi:crotonobetainyl-CoA:carnitine CoA-transferase CaiB-like acyl-CoA transferase